VLLKVIEKEQIYNTVSKAKSEALINLEQRLKLKTFDKLKKFLNIQKKKKML